MNPIFTKEERLELIHMPPINDQLPIKLSSGTTWHRIEGACVTCGEVIPEYLLRGEVYEAFKDVYKLRAVGYCVDCKFITCYSWTINKQGLAGRDKDGNWVQWRSTEQKPSIWSTIKQKFKRKVN